MDFREEFDNKMKEHTKIINNGGVQHLQSLLCEIRDYNYDSVSQIIGAINTRIEFLKERGK